MCPRYSNVTDGRTDGRTTYDNNTALALRASRGKVIKRTKNNSVRTQNQKQVTIIKEEI